MRRAILIVFVGFWISTGIVFAGGTGVACTPSTTCSDAQTLQTYDASCNVTTQQCTYGCSNNACNSAQAPAPSGGGGGGGGSGGTSTTQICTTSPCTITTPGTYSFTVPSHESLTIESWGAGGGGGGATGPKGSDGTASSFDSVVAGGGGGGAAEPCPVGPCPNGPDGPVGVASGGDINTDGNTSGNAPNGEVAGTTGCWDGCVGGPGSAPGAGGGAGHYPYGIGHTGRSGAYAKKTYSSGQLQVGSTITVVVGAGGAGGGGSYNGGAGAPGQVNIIWDTVAACVPSSSGDHLVTFANPGICSYTVPSYSTLTVELWGGGESGGNGYPWYTNSVGGPGGASTFFGLTAGGGSGGHGAGCVFLGCPMPRQGDGGTASGGDVNTNGNGGAEGSSWGANAPDGSIPGGKGQAYIYNSHGLPGGSPGAGGGGSHSFGVVPGGAGGGGGSGAYVKKTYAHGALTPGQQITVTVGAGGVDPYYNTYPATHGGNGGNGLLNISWTDPSSCSLTLSPTTVPYGGSGATLTYSSQNATRFYITNIGDVVPNTTGAPIVNSAGSYTGTVYDASNNTYACSPQGGTLTVTPPPAPTATITSSLGSSMQTGQTSTITATFSAGSGDTLTHDNIDSPEGTGLGATTNPDATKTYTFTPTQAGTYTFFARAQTQYFTSWTTYASVSVSVTNPPSCTPSTTYSCTGTDNNTIRETAVSAACVTTITDLSPSCQSPRFCSAGSPTCIDPAPQFGSSGHLRVIPSLVRSGANATVSWDVSNVQSCTVVGSNKDGTGENATGVWNTKGGTKTTSGITTKTTYTLDCLKLDDTHFTESAAVNIVPVFQER